VVELAAVFDQIRDSAISADERLIRGAVICDNLYFDCGGAAKRSKQP
jgi:hypothetical protein